MATVIQLDLSVTVGWDGRKQRVTFACDYVAKRAYFVDAAGKVRFTQIVWDEATKSHTCPGKISGGQRKTDNRRNAEEQDRINQIWTILRGSGACRMPVGTPLMQENGLI